MDARDNDHALGTSEGGGIEDQRKCEKTSEDAETSRRRSALSGTADVEQSKQQ